MFPVSKTGVQASAVIERTDRNQDGIKRQPIRMKVILFSVLVGWATANLQSWSVQSLLNKEFILSCNGSEMGNYTITKNDTLEWTKLGRPDKLTTDDHYELLEQDEIKNLQLKIRSVSGDSAGIYFCQVSSQGQPLLRIVRGLNLAGHLYEDKFDEYRNDVIRGVITAACVFSLVVGICLVDRFRFLTDEQKLKRRERIEDRLRRLQANGSSVGAVNSSFEPEADYDNIGKRNGPLSDVSFANTRF